MKNLRDLATPLTAGAFLLSGVTGVLLFFHLDTGLNKLAHQWLSWALLAGVVLHITSNLIAFKRHLYGRLGQGFVALFLLVLALSFFKWGTKDAPPNWAASVQTLAQLPLNELALVAHLPKEVLLSKLKQSGLEVHRDDQTIRDAVGDNLRKQAKALEIALTH
jgi:hypothetical protein